MFVVPLDGLKILLCVDCARFFSLEGRSPSPLHHYYPIWYARSSYRRIWRMAIANKHEQQETCLTWCDRQRSSARFSRVEMLGSDRPLHPITIIRFRMLEVVIGG
ncbi:MAG: hypothetical protein F6K30_26660 [Cyanothece sp. SIO2G6]|nr:hypothetical protein [Cyanothece sp. SIO2G6]